jgi:hypothetical protein
MLWAMAADLTPAGPLHHVGLSWSRATRQAVGAGGVLCDGFVFAFALAKLAVVSSIAAGSGHASE